MIAADVPTRNETAGDHLRLLHALSREIERAMEAISGNDLPALEDSVARQQELSDRLRQAADDLGFSAPRPFPGSAPELPDDDCMRQIRASSLRLQELNLRYSLLLKHSSRSVAMMATLFGSFRGQIQKEDPGAGLNQQTWSCRV